MLERLSDADISRIQQDALDRVSVSAPADASDPPHAQSGFSLATDDIIKYITNLSNGDARAALNLLELVLRAPPKTTTQKIYAMLKNTTLSRYEREVRTK